MKFASLFTGFGGADIGALQAGLEPIWGIEINPAIADLAQSNFPDCRIIKGDVGQFQYFHDWGRPDWIHSSPPCINASRAKNGKETSHDIYLAKGICQAITVLKPEYFSLENVTGYLQFDSFKSIKKCLSNNGYDERTWVLDCANHGVPQNRSRLFLVASKHAGKISGIYDMPMEPRISWRDAVKDLIPSLEPTTLTAWQQERLHSIFGSFTNVPDLVIQRSGASKRNGQPTNVTRYFYQPMFTIRAMGGNVRPSVNQVTLIIDGVPYEANPKCLARWQTFPDWYQLPDDKKLAVKGLGNAVPPLMMQKIIHAVLK